MRYAARLLIAVLLTASVLSSRAETHDDTGSARVLLLDIHGAIGPALSDFTVRGLEQAVNEGAAAVIVRLDTPGGLDTSMRVMIKAIVASQVPVVVWVAPGGARAASAGTYLLYASHVAAMAPGTNVGAATPIPLGGISPSGAPGADEKDKRAASSDDPLRRKVVNDAAAYLRALAELRGRNPDWAEKAVRDGASLSAAEAARAQVTDVLAGSLSELKLAVDGRTVTVGNKDRVLHSRDWEVVPVTPDWRTRLLTVITHPNVAYFLLLIGMYGLLFELYSPGGMVAGIIGVISLVLALYALHLLPVNYAGVVLIFIGVALMSAELFTPTFGVLGLGGVAAFVSGSVMLFDDRVEGFAVSLPLLLTVSGCFSALLLTTVVMFARQRKRPVVTGREEMEGATAVALEDFTARGRVRAHGEIWQARSVSPVRAGELLRVHRLDGLSLEVEPLDENTRAHRPSSRTKESM